MLRHYLNFSDLNHQECSSLLTFAHQVKAAVGQGVRQSYLMNRLLLMWFEKASTRTRTSFTAAMIQAGGQAVEMDVNNTQLQRGESINDTVQVLSRYCDFLMLRTNSHKTLTTVAALSQCPVVSGLSDFSHPCQVLADVMTYQECRGDLAQRQLAWVGDCNNVLYSWAEAAAMFGAHLRVACPSAYRRDLPTVEFVDTPAEAVVAADLVMTDVWVSMGDEAADRDLAFAPYQVTAELMAAAAKDALFMHCLPAHRGQEVSTDVIDGRHSVVWQQAENRLHVQKALLVGLMTEFAYPDVLPLAGVGA